MMILMASQCLWLFPFSLRATIMGKDLMNSLPFFFFKEEISSRAPVPLLGQGQSSHAQRAVPDVAACSLPRCRELVCS